MTWLVEMLQELGIGDKDAAGTLLRYGVRSVEGLWDLQEEDFNKMRNEFNLKPVTARKLMAKLKQERVRPCLLEIFAHHPTENLTLCFPQPAAAKAAAAPRVEANTSVADLVPQRRHQRHERSLVSHPDKGGQVARNNHFDESFELSDAESVDLVDISAEEDFLQDEAQEAAGGNSNIESGAAGAAETITSASTGGEQIQVAAEQGEESSGESASGEERQRIGAEELTAQESSSPCSSSCSPPSSVDGEASAEAAEEAGAGRAGAEEEEAGARMEGEEVEEVRELLNFVAESVPPPLLLAGSGGSGEE
eukprot:43060-Rhodomonas_salina.3